MPFNPNLVEHDLVSVTFDTDLSGKVNDAPPPVIGDTTVTVDNITSVPMGCVLRFSGDETYYYVSSSSGSPTTSITIDPPLKANLADNQDFTIYPHYDISDYITNKIAIKKSCEFRQNELILEPNIKFELFNKTSRFYDRDSWTTAFAHTQAYFTSRNSQGTTDNQYVKISWNRNSAGWKQKYAGKIVRHTLILNEKPKKISFETESVFNSLKDIRLADVTDIYNCHKYTSSTRNTKTVSGQYVEILRKICNDSQGLAINNKSYTVTAKYASGNTRTITIGTHSVQVGELITVSISDSIYDVRNAIVTSVTSTTVSYTLSQYSSETTTTSAAATAGDDVIYHNTGGPFTMTGELSSSLYRVKFAGHDTVYTFYFNGVGFNTINLISPATLTSNVANGERFWVSHPITEHTQATTTSAVNNGGGYGAGVTSITVDAFTVPPFNAALGYDTTGQYYCKFAGHATAYKMDSTVNNTTIKLNTGLTNAVVDNEVVTVYYPLAASATTGLSVANGLTQYRVKFDLASDYFSQTHQGWDYDILDCWWITQRWRKSDVEDSSCFDIIFDFCKKFNSVMFTDYINGIPYVFFRSKTNTSSSKITLSETSKMFKGEFDLRSNWEMYSPYSVSVGSTINYFNGGSLPTSYKYSNISGNQSFTSKIHVKFDTEIYTDDTLPAVDDLIIFNGDSGTYRVTAVSASSFTIAPPLTADQKKNTPFYVKPSDEMSLSFADCFNIKLKYPDIYVGGDDLYRLYNNGSFKYISNYTLDYTSAEANNYKFISLFLQPLIPIGRGYNRPLGKSLICGVSAVFVNTGVDGIGFIKQFTLDGEENKINTILTGGSGYYGAWTCAGGISEVYDVDTNDYSWQYFVGLSGKDSTYDERYRFIIELRDDGDSNVKLASDNGGELAADTTIDYDEETDTIYVGDYIQFQGHGTVYGVTDRTSTQLTISPALTDAVSNNETIRIKGSSFQYAVLRRTGTTPDVGSSRWNGCFYDGNVLNPDFTDYIYHTTATSIRRSVINSLTAGYSLNGTLATIIGNSHRGIHCQAGETTYAPMYVCETTNDEIIISDDGTYATYTTLAGGGATSPAIWIGTNDLSLSNPEDAKKAYDNILFIADYGNDKVIVYDVDSGYGYCVADSSLTPNAHCLDVDDFIQTWEITNGTVDICYNASYLQYQFYNQTRREIQSEHTDSQLSYLEYTLLDRVSIDDALIATASGDPKFYIYDYEIDMITHDHKLTLLESVE